MQVSDMEDQNAVNEVVKYIISEVEFANLNGPRIILEEPKQESVSCYLSSLTGTVTEDEIVAEIMEETLSKVQEEMQHIVANVETTSTFQNDAISTTTSRFGFKDGKFSCTKVAFTNAGQRKIQFSSFFQRSKRKACFSNSLEYDRFGLFKKKICLDQTFNRNTKSRNLMFSVESPMFIFQCKFLNPHQIQAHQISKQKSNTQLQDVPPKQLETKHTSRKSCTSLIPHVTQAIATKSSSSIVNSLAPAANPIYSNESSVFNSYDSLEKLQLFPELDMKSNTALTANNTNEPQEPIINISSGQLVQRDVKLGSKELSWNPWTWKKLESIKEKCIRSHGKYKQHFNSQKIHLFKALILVIFIIIESCEVPQPETENIENVERMEYFQEQCVTDAVVPHFENEPNQDDEHYVNITSPQSCNLTHDVPDILVQSNHNFDQVPTVESSPVLFDDMSLEDNSSESNHLSCSKSPIFPIAQDNEKSQDSSNYMRNTQEIFETLTQHATVLETEALNLDDKLPEQQMLEEVSILIPPTQFKDLDQKVPGCIEDLDDYILPPPQMYVPAVNDKESSDDDSSQEEVADGLLNYDVGFSMRKPMTEAPARLSRVQPLVTCNRPRRIGLSRNQRVPSLHLLNNY
ncbi:uncharacterized protein LOC108950512 [Ciona intestinalis]